MTTITIHYQSPEGDPFKVPRPHRVDIDEQGCAGLVRGGEIGPAGYLLGFCPTVTPDPDSWGELILAHQLYDGDVLPRDLIGYYPQFTGSGEETMFGYDMKIDRIEVSA
ncbi:hypothetical protein [Microbacterium sp. No. 7]|uniref:hypothetical protein n=1 Tax=Microbacterium sp. No. 7 TaxID=1714373 RepID=UPI0006D105D1|nr:hypothetical protein [Microbacterium sp. No. 7]ALJ19530.1 hypothetical protein AOA12_06250 [Microbacterium sp. No. 7]